jgi:hypothetical protein
MLTGRRQPPFHQGGGHLYIRQLDANFIQLDASRKQTIDKFGTFALDGR